MPTITAMSDWLSDRFRLAQRVGKSFSGKRDLYEVLGYPRVLGPRDHYELYRRGDIAGRIIDAFPAATWRVPPTVTDDTDNPERETAFESAFNDLVARHQLWHYCERVDRLASLGQYAALFLGLPGDDPRDPVDGRPGELLFLRPYREDNADITRWADNPANPRYGRPEQYLLQVSAENQERALRSLRAHWTRVVHVPAEGMEEDDIYGQPRLERVHNRLMDLQKVMGGSAEAFWLNANAGLRLKADKDANLGADEIEELRKQAEDYQHQMRRILAMRGVEADHLSVEIADPANNVDKLVDLIAGATGIPKRMLIGSERGEIASTQDETNWLARISERRENYATPVIIRPVIDRLIEYGVLPQPKGGYEVEWPAVEALSEEDRAKVAKTRAEALKAYADAMGADMIVPPGEFREDFLGLDPQPDGGFPQEPPEVPGAGDEPGE